MGSGAVSLVGGAKGGQNQIVWFKLPSMEDPPFLASLILATA